MPPNRPVASVTAFSELCGSVMSSRVTSRFSCSPTAAPTTSGLRPVATTWWPAASAARAKSTPMPRPAPVISQVLGVVSLLIAIDGATESEEVRGPLHPCTDRAPHAPPDQPYPASMDVRSEIRDFLSSRRARITPEDAGLKVFGQRRVPGLRREEVATLAGLSVEYYSRLERGNLGGASDGVLDALADALRLDEAERAHLLDLARACQPTARDR